MHSQFDNNNAKEEIRKKKKTSPEKRDINFKLIISLTYEYNYTYTLFSYTTLFNSQWRLVLFVVTF